MKKIECGQFYLEPVPYSNGRWYYSIDYNHGDVFEADEIIKQGRELKGDVLTFVSYPEGKVCYQSQRRRRLSYTSPVFCDDRIYYLSVDFDSRIVSINYFDPASDKAGVKNVFSLNKLDTLYNLRLDLDPLTVSVQYSRESEMIFHIIYPEDAVLRGDIRESMYCRDGNKLYFSQWYEDEEENYFEKTIIRDINTGEILDEFEGDITIMPDGQKWLIK